MDSDDEKHNLTNNAHENTAQRLSQSSHTSVDAASLLVKAADHGAEASQENIHSGAGDIEQTIPQVHHMLEKVELPLSGNNIDRDCLIVCICLLTHVIN